MAGGRNIITTSTTVPRKVMIVVDPTRESAAALQYALSHAIIDHDEVILLHVDNPNSWRNAITTFLKRPNGGFPNINININPNANANSNSNSNSNANGNGNGNVNANSNSNFNSNFNFNFNSNSNSNSNSNATATATAASDGGGGGGAADVDFLEEMKKLCQVAHPKLKVRTARVEMEGKDKANMIMAQTKTLGIDLLVIGQRRSLSTAILGYRRSGGPMKGTKMLDTAEYLIENSKCTCVAVQKKGQNAGYLLNTKTHRNFWLLA